MQRKDFEIFLYKNRLNESSILEMLPNLSSKTIQYLARDLEHSEPSTDDLYVFTDGNCKKNGGINAQAAYGVYFTDDTDSMFYDLNFVGPVVEDPTNQKAELMAFWKLYTVINENSRLFEGKRVILCSDSLYAIKCVTEWSKNWIKNGWKTSKNESVKNADIIKRIIAEKEACAVEVVFKHVFSHTKEPHDKSSKEYKLWYGNDVVDKLINNFLKNLL
jgi:ribonuclease HI